MKEQLKHIPLKDIAPLHGVDDDAYFDYLVKSFKHGWNGRPLLVVKNIDKRRRKYRAITGSHRYAAARRTGFIEIPCLVIESKVMLDMIRLFDEEPDYNVYVTFSDTLKKEKLYLAAVLMSCDYH